MCVGVLLKRVCIFIDHFKSGYGDLLFILVEKEDEKGYLFPYGSFNWPIKNPYVSSSPILYRKHLRTKPNLTTNLNLFITKRFLLSFALIALKERYRYPPQIWGKRKEKKKDQSGGVGPFLHLHANWLFSSSLVSRPSSLTKRKEDSLYLTLPTEPLPPPPLEKKKNIFIYHKKGRSRQKGGGSQSSLKIVKN